MNDASYPSPGLKEAEAPETAPWALSTLNQDLDVLYVAVDSLRGKMQPILRSIDASDDETWKRAANGSGASDVTREIYARVEQVRELTAIVYDMTNRLDL